LRLDEFVQLLGIIALLAIFFGPFVD